ncbi:MAG TPA: hypothetical protein VE685_22385, partial [Thermoanaerobaculia bacterium]|nr:hypothetical protein [Thermoanaerobaculia bacterium]
MDVGGNIVPLREAVKGSIPRPNQIDRAKTGAIQERPFPGRIARCPREKVFSTRYWSIVEIWESLAADMSCAPELEGIKLAGNAVAAIKAWKSQGKNLSRKGKDP